MAQEIVAVIVRLAAAHPPRSLAAVEVVTRRGRMIVATVIMIGVIGIDPGVPMIVNPRKTVSNPKKGRTVLMAMIKKVGFTY